MINRNNNISGVYINGTFSGDGSGLTGLPGGVGATGPTGPSGATGATGPAGSGSVSMFNSLIVPATASIYPFYKLNTPALSYATTAYSVLGNVYFIPVNLLEGEIINDVAVYCSTGVASATMSIALYSIGQDSVGRYYANTLLTNFGDVSLATTGRKTITGLNYTIPASIDGIYYFAYTKVGGVSTPAILGPANTLSLVYYASLDGSIMNRPMGVFKSGSTTFPSTISISDWTGYTHQTSFVYIGYR